MLQRVTMDGIELPRLYIAENRADAELAMSKGIPFIRWTHGQDELIRILLRPVLEKLFPHIKWNNVLGPRRKFKTNVIIGDTGDTEDIESTKLSEAPAKEQAPSKEEPEGISDGKKAELLEEDKVRTDEDGVVTEDSISTSGARLFRGGAGDVLTKTMSLEDYVGDLNSSVDLEVLQRLRLMPAFIGDILDCIKINIGSGMRWREGYNKRLGMTVGRFDSARQLPNLIILDVSSSIPRGISATMITLIDTLRTQLSADLIITASRSKFYPMGCELPDPQKIRYEFGWSNESDQFFDILNTNIRGKHYGHVFSFGDNDTPDYYYPQEDLCLIGTVVEHVHHYHTGMWNDGTNLKTGYAKWCHMLSKAPLEEYDQQWCKVMTTY